MPSVSPAQHNLMELADHNPAAAKRLGISKKVAHEYVEADKGKHFKKAVRKGKKKTY